MPCWLDRDLGARRRVVGWCRFGWCRFGWCRFGRCRFGRCRFGRRRFGRCRFKRRLNWCLKGFTSITTCFHQFGLQTI
jgi:hypothetical protein